MRQIALAALFLATVTGCANVTVKPVANSFGSKGVALEANEAGVRFYRPTPYVWITRTQPSDKVNVVTVEEKKGEKTTKSTVSLDTEPGYSATIVVLPDFSQEYIIQWNAGIGSVNPHFELSDGWNLKAFDSKVETKTAENIQAVTGTITSLGKLAAGGLLAKSTEFKGAGLYRLKMAPGTGTLSLGELVLGLE